MRAFQQRLDTAISTESLTLISSSKEKDGSPQKEQKTTRSPRIATVIQECIQNVERATHFNWKIIPFETQQKHIVP